MRNTHHLLEKQLPRVDRLETTIILAEYSPNHNNNHTKQCFTSKTTVFRIIQPQTYMHFKHLSAKKGQNATHQNRLPFCPVSEYYQKTEL